MNKMIWDEFKLAIMKNFTAKQLPTIIDDYVNERFTGILQVDVKLFGNNQTRSRLIVFEDGSIVHAGLNLPKPNQLVQQMGLHFQRNNVVPALNLVSKKNHEHTSIGEYFKLFFQLGIFQVQELESFMQAMIVWTIEQLLPYPGEVKVASESLSVLHYLYDLPRFNWSELAATLGQRQDIWASLAPLITSGEVIPKPITDQQGLNIQKQALEHIKRHIDGRHSITQIAYELQQDPLQLAQTYYSWLEKAWIRFEEPRPVTPPTTNNGQQQSLPTIMSVDDSPVVQLMIKRSISDHYQVVLANNAVDALNLLNSQPISLLLLDVTMPDINGLELCRTIRSINKFKHLPIIMLTAKDGMIDKVKGKVAGATEYLTKPIARDRLLVMLEKHIPDVISSTNKPAVSDLQCVA